MWFLYVEISHGLPASRPGIFSHITVVREIEAMGVTINVPQPAGHPRPYLQPCDVVTPVTRGDEDQEKGQSKKRKEERSQGSKFAHKAGHFLCLSWAVFNAVRPFARCETRHCAPFVPDSGLGREVLSLAIHHTKTVSSGGGVFGYYQYCCCHGPWGYEAKGSGRKGLGVTEGGDRGLVWWSRNNRKCPSPLDRPHPNPTKKSKGVNGNCDIFTWLCAWILQM